MRARVEIERYFISKSVNPLSLYMLSEGQRKVLANLLLGLEEENAFFPTVHASSTEPDESLQYPGVINISGDCSDGESDDELVSTETEKYLGELDVSGYLSAVLAKDDVGAFEAFLTKLKQFSEEIGDVKFLSHYYMLKLELKGCLLQCAKDQLLSLEGTLPDLLPIAESGVKAARRDFDVCIMEAHQEENMVGSPYRQVASRRMVLVCFEAGAMQCAKALVKHGVTFNYQGKCGTEAVDKLFSESKRCNVSAKPLIRRGVGVFSGDKESKKEEGRAVIDRESMGLR